VSASSTLCGHCEHSNWHLYSHIICRFRFLLHVTSHNLVTSWSGSCHLLIALFLLIAGRCLTADYWDKQCPHDWLAMDNLWMQHVVCIFVHADVLFGTACLCADHDLCYCRAFVCPSITSFGRHTLLPRRVCCCGPGWQEISIDCFVALAANASSVTLSADVWSWWQSCFTVGLAAVLKLYIAYHYCTAV